MLASLHVAVLDTFIASEPNLQMSVWRAFIQGEPAAYEVPSLGQLEVQPLITITKEHAEQVFHNYLIFGLGAKKPTVVVFSVNSQLIAVVVETVRDFRIFENFVLTKSPRDLRVKATAILFMAFSEVQEFAAMALAQK